MSPADPASRLIAALAKRYHLERELDQGGMATVYLVRDRLLRTREYAVLANR